MPDNIEIVAKAFRDYAEGDENAWHPLIDPDITMYHPLFLMPRQLNGAQAYHRHADEIAEVFPDFALVDNHYFEGQDGRVMMYTTAIGTRADGGEPKLLHRFACIWTMRDGRFWHCEFFMNPEEAKHAIGTVRRELKDD